MKKQAETTAFLIQNLIDAGCPYDMIERFMACYEQENPFEGLRILSKQRRQLLDDMHDSQKKLDCLDYLIYQLKKES